MPSCHWFLVPFPLKELFSPNPLGILPVADLQPGCAWQVGINFSLCHYTFEIALPDKIEQLLTHALNVVTVQQPFTVCWDQATQPVLTICQGQVTQVLAVREQEIKRVVARLTSAVNWEVPVLSRQTISPSSTASWAPHSRGRARFRAVKDFKNVEDSMACHRSSCFENRDLSRTMVLCSLATR